ncbi:MAG: hypothetical protein Q4D04_10845 [Clostridia bacterium]|nr:hypothetical protein [Clostridia bacterium]
MVAPKAENIGDAQEYSTGPAGVSSWVAVRLDSDPDSLWSNITDGIKQGNGTDFGIIKTDDANAVVTLNRQSGETVMALTESGKTAGVSSVVLAQLNQRYLKSARQLSSKDSGNKSYTTITNYSVLVDVNINDGDGMGLLLNGRGKYNGSDSNKVSDTGLMFQIAAKSDSLPMRLWKNGVQHQNASYKSWGIGESTGGKRTPPGFDVSDNIAYTSDSLPYKFTGHGKVSKTSDPYGPFYGPGYMKNDLFKYDSDYYSNRNDGTIKPGYLSGTVIQPERLPPYNGERVRMLVTVLEYYTTYLKEPHFIVRVKFLKKFDENSLKSPADSDPWLSGDTWFKSEPIWFGDFAGAHPEKIVSGGDTYYRFYVRNNVTGSSAVSFDVKEEQINFQTSNGNKTNGNFYVTRVPIGESLSDSDHVETLFEAKDINLVSELKKTSNFPKKDSDARTLALYENPANPRYLGLRIWTNTKSPYKVYFYGVDFAPGFSANELKAIMPKEAKMYEISQTGEETQMQDAGISDGVIALSRGLNNKLFGSSGKSDGDGNGLYVSVTSGDKGVMYLQNKKIDDKGELKNRKS